MITEDKITDLFYFADDFCKYFSSELKKHQMSDGKHIAINLESYQMQKSSLF